MALRITAIPIRSGDPGISCVYFSVLIIWRIINFYISGEDIVTICKVCINHYGLISQKTGKHFLHVKHRYCYNGTAMQSAFWL